MTARKTLLTVFTMLLPAITNAQTSTTQIASRLSSPVFATAAPGDHDRMFFIEQGTGNVRILDMATEEVLDDPYLTVPNLDTGFEKGLLGLAFHPDFADNGKLFVYASQNGGSRNHRSHVFEYTVDEPMTNNVVDGSTQRSVLRFDQPFPNHNGGWIGFDPTATGDARNHLYIGTGDGGSANDPENNSQDITDNLLGKLLRIDIASDDFSSSDIQNYSIPASNPFVNREGDDEIFAYGLRNPWRNSFDRQTGDIWIGDVGQNEVEEIDLLPAGSSGQNYGWRVMEGTDCFNTGDSRDGNLSCNDVSLTPPAYEYQHDNGSFGGSSVTGGYVYRGPLKEFQGQYFFADWGSGHIWTRDPDSGTVLNRNSELVADSGRPNQAVGSFGEDADGNLYVVSTGFSQNSGSIYRIQSASRDAVWDGSTWTRDGVSGADFEDGDHLVLRQSQLTSNDAQRVAALTLEGATINLSARTEVVSGNITVPESLSSSVTVAGNGSLVGTSGAIRKLGGGELTLNLAEPSSDMLAVHAGSVDLNGAAFARMKVANDALLIIRDLPFNRDSLEVGPDAALVVDFEGQITVAQSIDDGLIAMLEERAITVLSSEPIDAIGDVVLEDLSDGAALSNLANGGITITPQWELVDEGANLNLTLVRGVGGDVNLDGMVDFADFLIFAGNFGEPSFNGWSDGDFSGHGVVAFSDFLQLAENFGNVGYREVLSPSPVPEPQGVMLFAIGLIGLCYARRRCVN